MSYRAVTGILLLLAGGLQPPALGQQSARGEVIFYATDAQDALASFEQNARHVSVVAPQSYRVDARGVLTGSVPDALLDVTRRHGVRVMPLIINPGWNSELFSTLVNDSSARARMIARMVELAKAHGFWGWQYDFEQIHARDRDALTRLYRETAAALSAAGLKLSIAVYPDPDPRADASPYHAWIRESHSSAYDLVALAASGDFISLMTYLQHGSRTPPGPVGGLPYMQRVVENALALGVPREKLSLGIPLFSMHWAAQWSHEREGFSGARGMGWPATQTTLRAAAVPLVWDSVQGSNHARWEKNGTFEYAWVEDARAFEAKLDLQRRYGLRGISVWRIGQEDPRIWEKL